MSGTRRVKRNKKNTFLDYTSRVRNHLIDERYTYKGGICFYGGSAGGFTGGAVANMAPELFFSMLLLVPFVDTMTTMLNENFLLHLVSGKCGAPNQGVKNTLSIFCLIPLIIILTQRTTQQCL